MRHIISDSELLLLKEEWGLTEEEAGWMKNLDARNIKKTVNLLRGYFKPTVIQKAIRRPSFLFGGCSTLDIILVGGFGEVISKYRELFRYQS